MKYIIDIEKVEGTDLYRAKGASTLVFDEWGIKNILTPLPEPTKPEVDWTKVEVDTPILVSVNGKEWHNRHFTKYENDTVYAWNDGGTSFTKNGYYGWGYAKLAEAGE